MVSYIPDGKVKQNIVKQLEKVKIYPEKIPKLQETIKTIYYESHVEAGENVGILAAGNIGEIMTQKTLNSLDACERVVIELNGATTDVCIGDIIDTNFRLHKNNIERFVYQEEDPFLEKTIGYVDRLNVSNISMHILSMDENGNTKWRQILAMIRHPLYNRLLKVKLKDGRRVRATSAKSFLVKREGKIVPINGSELRLGDKLVVTTKYENNIVLTNKVGIFELSDVFGSFIGSYLINGYISDTDIIITTRHPKTIVKFCDTMANTGIKYLASKKGYKMKSVSRYETVMSNSDGETEIRLQSKTLCDFLRDTCGSYLGTKHVPDFAYNANDSFVKSLLATCFRRETITVYSSRLIDGLSYLMTRYDMYCIRKKACDSYIITISRSDCEKLRLNIQYPCQQEYTEIDIASIKEVRSSNGFVYDFTVADTKTFNILSGIAMADSFHSSGISVKTVVAGVPRFTELISSTKKPKYTMCTVYPSNPIFDIEDIRKIGRRISEVRFRDLIEKISMKMDDNDTNIIETFCMIYDDDKLNSTLEDRIIYKVTLKRKQLYDSRISICDIATKVKTYVNDNYKLNDDEYFVCIWSPINLSTIYIFTNNASLNPKSLGCILLYGIPCMKNIEYKKTRESWFIEVDGCDIDSMLTLDNIDKTTVMCNDMWRIYEYFGIEATRQFLMEEFTNIVSNDGTFVHEGNIKMLVDVMTSTGTITSVSRYSVKKSDTGVLGKASFEESFSNMITGAQQGQTDNIDGVSSAVIVGRGIGTGTGLPVLIQKMI